MTVGRGGVLADEGQGVVGLPVLAADDRFHDIGEIGTVARLSQNPRIGGGNGPVDGGVGGGPHVGAIGVGEGRRVADGFAGERHRKGSDPGAIDGEFQIRGVNGGVSGEWNVVKAEAAGDVGAGSVLTEVDLVPARRISVAVVISGVVAALGDGEHDRGGDGEGLEHHRVGGEFEPVDFVGGYVLQSDEFRPVQVESVLAQVGPVISTLEEFSLSDDGLVLFALVANLINSSIGTGMLGGNVDVHIEFPDPTGKVGESPRSNTAGIVLCFCRRKGRRVA